MTRATNGFKLAAQRKKAIALVGAIDAIALERGTNPHSDAMKIVLLLDYDWRDNEQVWAALTKRARVTPPSDDTKAIVRGIYADRVRSPQRLEARVH